MLGDGVAYAARHLDPAVIIDMATLTGAQGITTGRRHASVLSNDEGLETMVVRCGRSTGDLVHPVVFCPEFFCEEFRCICMAFWSALTCGCGGEGEGGGGGLEKGSLKPRWITHGKPSRLSEPSH